MWSIHAVYRPKRLSNCLHHIRGSCSGRLQVALQPIRKAAFPQNDPLFRIRAADQQIHSSLVAEIFSHLRRLAS